MAGRRLCAGEPFWAAKKKHESVNSRVLASVKAPRRGPGGRRPQPFHPAARRVAIRLRASAVLIWSISPRLFVIRTSPTSS